MCREVACSVLRLEACTKPITLEELERKLLSRLPARVCFEEDCLKGIAFVKKQAVGNGKNLRYLNADEMTLDPDAR